MIAINFLVLWYSGYLFWQKLEVRGFNTAKEACEFAEVLEKESRGKTVIQMEGSKGHEVNCIPFTVFESFIVERVKK